MQTDWLVPVAYLSNLIYSVSVMDIINHLFFVEHLTLICNSFLVLIFDVQ